MSCLLCESQNMAAFPAEMMIHFSGLTNLDNPGVMAFSTLIVCLDCGFSCFATPQSQLAVLAKRVPNGKASTRHENAGSVVRHDGNALRKNA